MAHADFRAKQLSSCSTACYKSHQLTHATNSSDRVEEAAPSEPGPSSTAGPSSSTNASLSEQVRQLLASNLQLKAELKGVLDIANGDAEFEPVEHSRTTGPSRRPESKANQKTKNAMARLQQLRESGMFESPEVQRFIELGRALAGGYKNGGLNA